MSGRKRGGLGAFVAVGLALALGAPQAFAASHPDLAPAPPSLRLLTADQRPTLFHSRGRASLDGLGLFVAAEGGELRLDVTRPGYGDWRVVQVDGETGAALRELPAGVANGWRGLERFLRIAFRDAEGRVVARATKRFCPNVYWERVDDSGPAASRYPWGCSNGFPFQSGMVWGIDAGWASSAWLGRIKLDPGRYTARVSILAPYRQIFAIPTEHAKAVLSVRVKRLRHPGGGRPEELSPVPAEPRRAAAQPRPGGTPPSPLAAETVSDPDPATLPDPAALPLWGIGTAHQRGRDLLRFRASPWNAGPAPLVVEGFRRSGEDLMEAHQYFYDADGEVAGRAPAGSMELHEGGGHDHWHFRQFTRFSLLDPGGSEVVRSHKQSFCLAPTNPVDLTVAGAEWSAWDRRGSVCGGPGSIWIREDLPAGWADTYSQSVAGQAFNVTKVPNGTYRLRVEVNPLGQLHEVSGDNNIADRMIRLGGKPGARRVTVRPWRGIDA